MIRTAPFSGGGKKGGGSGQKNGMFTGKKGEIEPEEMTAASRGRKE